MIDDRTERIRDLQQRITQWKRVHDHEIQQERDVQANLHESLSLAWRVGALGSLPAACWLLCWALSSIATESTVIQVLTSIGVIFTFEVVTFSAARASGLMAHWWFCCSSIRKRVATVAISLLADAVLFLWVIVLARW